MMEWLKRVRKAFAAMARGYQGAEQNRLTADFAPSTTSQNQETYEGLTVVRARSRDLCRNAPYARRARSIIVNNVIGSGIGLQCKLKNRLGRPAEKVNEAIEEAWQRWCRAEFCTVGGIIPFADLERLLMAETFEAGEMFVRERFEDRGSGIPYCLEPVESERVPHEVPYSITTKKNTLGVDVDEFFRPQAYWIADGYPSELLSFSIRPRRVERVEADRVIHLQVMLRWPQTRGMPWLAPVIKKINHANAYTEAELIAARGAANYMGSWEGTSDFPGVPEPPHADGSRQTKLAPGTVLDPVAGRKFVLHSPNRPNAALDPFMRYLLKEIAVGQDLPYSSLSGDYSDTNYSSSRLALLDERDTWRHLQQWYVRGFRQRVFRVWLRQAVMVGAIAGIDAEDYVMNPEKYECAVKYKCRGWSWVDPEKEVNSAKEAIRAGLTTRTHVVSQTADGRDVEDIDEERKQEIEDAEALGLQFDVDSPDTGAGAQPTPKPRPEEGTGEQDRLRRIK